MGVLKNSVEIWEVKLEQLKQYIDKNAKRPSSCDKNKITKALGYWTSLQIQNFKNIKKISVMNDEKIYNHWKKFITNDKYSQYFDSSMTKWYSIFKKLKAYLDKYNQKPSCNDIDKEISFLRDWTKRQQTNYSTCDRIMKNEKIREEWLNFVSNEKYEKYFMTDEMEWYKTFFEVQEYIKKYNKRPSAVSKNDNIKKMGCWISRQLISHYKYQAIMKTNKKIFDEWAKFVSDPEYIAHFMTSEEEWYYKFNQIKQYIDLHDMRPSIYDKDSKIATIALWISTQQRNYNAKKKTMKNIKIYQEWTNFINGDYKKYFYSNDEKWFEMLDQTKDFIDVYDKKPSRNDIDPKIQKIGYWLDTQLMNAKKNINAMKNQTIKIEWDNFIFDVKYAKFFKNSTLDSLIVVKSDCVSNDNNSITKLNKQIKKSNSPKNLKKSEKVKKVETIEINETKELENLENELNVILYEKSISNSSKKSNNSRKNIKIIN